ncbi:MULTISPECIES: LacI family DNA-binding transcriptional regulator [Comamonas]|uniref:LacI family DNA-binding transcriptional regulator n=1 Tax=Comamonas TaxID=283 RepID=UPI00051034FE|nr:MULTISPECIES: LacI family DNA-binding transcriptional regulator [Comamonas]KGG82412.1 LacI family transcriptional regulator [Comamonas thiooxydans]GAO72040.1 ribose operon repressor [Comamonas sp. E6]
MKSSSHAPTLRSIAQELKIHVSTVSRVLNGTDEDARAAASEPTVRRIRELAQQRNYRPNLQAKGLRTNRSNSIAAFLPYISDLVGAMIYEGINEAALRRGYVTFMAHTGDNLEHEREQLANALGRKVDGLIFADARPQCRPMLDELQQRGMPLVLVSRHLGPDFCSITCDDLLGGRMAAEHLLSLGHTRLAVLAGLEFASTGADRARGFVDHCAACGVDIPSQWVLHSAFHADAGYQMGLQLFSRRPFPTAVFATNDFLAIGLMGAARDAGLRIGQDVAIVGFNDTPLAAYLPVALTTIHSPMHEMGFRGMELLQQCISGMRPDSVRLQPQLRIRHSTQPDAKLEAPRHLSPLHT